MDIGKLSPWEGTWVLAEVDSWSVDHHSLNSLNPVN